MFDLEKYLDLLERASMSMATNPGDTELAAKIAGYRKRIRQRFEERSTYLTDPLALAVLFHVTYEKLAPQMGYETREETKVFNPNSFNGKLMIATCAEIQEAIREDDDDDGL